MASPENIALSVLGMNALLITSTAALGPRGRFKRNVIHEVESLFSTVKDVTPSPVTEADLAPLPEPVQRWLRAAHTVGKPRPLTVRLKQEGHYNVGGPMGWLPLRAEQYYTTNPPGYVWFADIGRLFPRLAGSDRYMGGKGELDIRMFSLFSVVHSKGMETDQAALLRYLSETVWFPAGVLSPAITWEGIDALTARATLSHGGTSASGIFSFSERGDATNFRADRYRFEKKRFTLDPWSTPTKAHGEFDGVRISSEGEVVWNLPSGDQPYVRVHITSLDYNRPEPYT